MNTIFHSARSPNDLVRASGHVPASEAIECALDAIYGQEPTARQREVFKTISRARWPSSAPNTVLVQKGRRSMWTSTAGEILVKDALNPALDAYAPPGARLHFLIVTPLLAQGREAAYAAKMALEGKANLGVRYEMRGAGDSVEIRIAAPVFGTERIIAIRSASDVAGRGLAVPTLIFDEAAFLPSAAWHQVRDEQIIASLLPATAQFGDERRVVFITSPGAPGSHVHKLYEKPPKGALLFDAATWTWNPDLSREKCLELSNGDETQFAIEYGAKRWGLAGESWLDDSRCFASIDRTGRLTPKGARPIPGVVVVDPANVGGDESAFGVGFAISRSISADKAPVRELVVEYLESWKTSREHPVTMERIAERAAALSTAHGGIPVVSTTGASSISLTT